MGLDSFRAWPYPLAVAAFFVIVLLRAGGTYALGRGAHAGAEHSRLHRLLRRPGFRRAERLVQRWGAPVVTASFLTVGVQTLVNLAAGIGRMPLRRYLPALVLGGLIWALIHATAWTAGLVAVRRLWELSPVAAIVVVGVLVLALAGYVALQRTRGKDRDDRTGLAAHD